MFVRRTVVLACVLACSAGLATAQSEWHGHETVVPPPQSGDWDAERYLTTVLEVNGTYHMYFFGRQNPGEEPLYWYWDIGHATSSDGVTWVMDPANPVLTRGAAGEWDDHAVAFPAVIHDGSEFRMWYTGTDGEHGRVGYATSPDGSTWTPHDGNPVMDAGAPGSFDDLGVWPETVLFDGARYRIWYTGAHGLVSTDYDWRIGYAESPDGLSWTKHPLPVLDPGSGWDGWLVYAPSVLFDGARYHMWYTGAGTFPNIGYAESEDGLDWIRYFGNPLIGNGNSHSTVLYDGDAGVFEMWYSKLADFSILRATSECCSMVYASFIPAAAQAAGANGAFFQTDVDLSNAGGQSAQFHFMWLPRGADNSNPLVSDTFTLGANMSVRYANVLAEVFGLEANVYGALGVASASPQLMAVSRTFTPLAGAAGGCFGQAIPAVKASDMIRFGDRRRILFVSEQQDLRTNIGCQNGVPRNALVTLRLYAADGTSLGTQYLALPPWGNDQINRVFGDYQPVNGFVDVVNEIPDTSFTCYGSVLDNVTNDPMTVLPQ